MYKIRESSSLPLWHFAAAILSPVQPPSTLPPRSSRVRRQSATLAPNRNTSMPSSLGRPSRDSSPDSAADSVSSSTCARLRPPSVFTTHTATHPHCAVPLLIRPPHLITHFLFQKRKVLTHAKPQGRSRQSVAAAATLNTAAEITSLCCCSRTGLAHPLSPPASLVIQLQLFFLQNKAK